MGSTGLERPALSRSQGLSDGNPLPLDTLHILLFGHEALTRRARTVVWMNPTLRRLIATLQTLVRERGLSGLAAPVLGFPWRIAVLRAEDEVLTLINPRLTTRIGRPVVRLETCWCFPGVQAAVLRSPEVHLESFDAEGRLFQVRLQGTAALAAQHELDHLFGVLLPQRALPDSVVWRVRSPSPEGKGSRRAYPTTWEEVSRFYAWKGERTLSSLPDEGFLSQEEWEAFLSSQGQEGRERT